MLLKEGILCGRWVLKLTDNFIVKKKDNEKREVVGFSIEKNSH
jgi:hypothetical protein